MDISTLLINKHQLKMMQKKKTERLLAPLTWVVTLRFTFNNIHQQNSHKRLNYFLLKVKFWVHFICVFILDYFFFWCKGKLTFFLSLKLGNMGGLSFILWLQNTFRKRIKTSTFLSIRFRDTKCWEEDILIHYYLEYKFITKKKGNLAIFTKFVIVQVFWYCN